MTYIIGARCVDGVVLIADKKVTGGVKPHTNKIKQLNVFPSIIFTTAGVQSLFEEFLEDVNGRSIRHQKEIENYNKKNPENPKIFTIIDFKHICSEILKKMKKTYSEIEEEIPFEQALQVLFATSETRPPDTRTVSKLYAMNIKTCYPEPIEEGRVIPIGISYIGDIFLKQFELSGESKMINFSMKDVARIGAFIIKYVEKEKLHDGIGVGDQEPQIWFVKDGEMPKEIIGKELQVLLEDVDGEVTNMIKKIGSNSGFLRS
jgi:hypothetical protein